MRKQVRNDSRNRARQPGKTDKKSIDDRKRGDNNVEEQLKRLRKRMDELTKEDICVAFSGGVDSSLLLKAAVKAADRNHTRVYAVTMRTRLQPGGDMEIAARVAKECGAEYVVLHLDESREERILENSKERCYYCKSFLFRELKRWAEKRGITVLLEGSNRDDLEVYRPGLRAVKELGVQSPLAELGITKSEVRQMAGALGVSVASRPSAPCMATRLPYGTRLDFGVLDRLAAGEDRMRSLGFDVVRLRLHGDILRLEVAAERLADAVAQRGTITAALRELGFHYITLDMEGFRSGSMDLW